MRYWMRLTAASVLVTSVLAPSWAAAHGGHSGLRGPHAAAPRGPMKDTVTVPSLTPEGRFVYGPAYGHPPILGPNLGRVPARARGMYAAPIVVPGYYLPPAYMEPEPLAVYEYAPAFPPPPPSALAPRPDRTATKAEPTRVASAPPTTIYYCAESKAYTDDRTSMECPAGWRRMSR